MLIVFIGQKWKRIGILGGMGPEATIELYRKVIEIFQQKYNAKYDADFPEIILLNLPLLDVVESMSEGIKEQLIYGVKKLEAAGVDFIAVPCNTVNIYLSEMRKAVNIPIIDIVKETAQEAEDLGLNEVGILVTEATLCRNIFAPYFPRLIKPITEEQKILTQIILRIMSGNKSSDDLNLLLEMINSLKKRGAQKVILGCTELPLLITENKDTISTIDVLARRIVTEAVKEGGK